MRDEINHSGSWATNPKNRKWMLAILTALLLFDARLWMVWPYPSKLEPITITAGAVLLLCNHVVASFASPETQRRMVWPQSILTALFCGLAVTFWLATVVNR
ncbi:MAG TPA: hypothetical protein VGQ30_07765 [Gemmatimonadaceae bacterium]|nr:hypothetical protein [Gemmatimonadaceae bacterium]